MANQILFFLLNGAGTLILETAWLKKQIAIFGSSPESYGSILFAYFLGVSGGSWYFRKKQVVEGHSSLFYAGFISALLLSFLLPVLIFKGLPFPADFIFGNPFMYRTVVWVLALIAIVPACFFLGGFFPLIARTVTRGHFVLLYGVQTSGALLGIFFGAFYLPYAFGYLMTFLLGIGVNAVSLLFFQRSLKGRMSETGEEPEGETGPLRLAALSFFSGFFSLLLQVLWIRFIALGTDNSIYAFGSVSLLILVQLTLSSFVTARLPSRWFSKRHGVSALIFFSIAGLLLSTWVYVRMTNGLEITMITNAAGLSRSLRFAASFIILGYVFPSFIFPFLLRSLKTGGMAAGGAYNVGALIAANGLGCAMGSFLASFAFLPFLGMWASLLIALLGYSCYLLLFEPVRSRIPVVALCVVLILAFHPLRYPLVTPTNPLGSGPPGSVVWVKEGKYGIVSVIDYANTVRSLWLNNTYLLEAGMNDMTGTYRMGLIPAVLNPRAKSIAMIGVGTGITASAFLTTTAERITLIEMIPEVVTAASDHFRLYNMDVLRDLRVRTVVDDGRHYLKIQTEMFDIICSDLFTPWNEGSAYLYTVDHFRNAKEKLNPGGLFCLWLPLYQMTREEFLIIAKSFSSVFPHTTVWQLAIMPDRNIAALIGTDNIKTESVIESVKNRPAALPMRDPFIQGHVSGIFSRYVGPVIPSAPVWKDMPLNTLDRPVIEFKAAQDNRILMKGKELMALLEELFRLPGNPEGKYFSSYDQTIESYRLAGWYLNLYGYFYGIGDQQKADEYLRKGTIPALSLPTAQLQK